MDYQSVLNEIETWPIGELKDLLKTCATYASHARGGHERPGRESAHQGGPGGRGHGHAHHCSGRHHRGEGTAGERAGIVTAAVAAGATAHATPDTPDVGSTPAKTFTLRGIKESPPYFHDGRLLTLEESVEFFDLVLELKLDADERHALVAFPRRL